MNNMILKIIVISIFFTPWLSHTRMMSPGVAQAELNRMIRDAKKSPPSSEKIKQLLNDISPSLKGDYEDMINQVSSRKSSNIETKKDIDNIDAAIFIIKVQIEKGLSKKDALILVESLAGDKDFNFDDQRATIFKDLANKIIERKFNKIYKKDFDVTNMFEEIDNDEEVKQQGEKQIQEQKKINEENISPEKLSEFIKSLGYYFEETFGKELTLDQSEIVILNEQQERLKSTDKAFDVVTKNINTFIEELYKYRKQYTANLVGVQNGFIKFFEAFNLLYGMTDSIDKSVPCDVLDGLRYIFTKADSILNSTIKFGKLIDPGILKDKKEKNKSLSGSNGSLSGSEEYTKFINQMGFIQEKIDKNKCK